MNAKVDVGDRARIVSEHFPDGGGAAGYDR
jgi:hypothetical protein